MAGRCRSPPAVIARNERGVTVRATRITTPMTIDGRLDEAVYAQVPAITEFVQQEPHEGAPVSESTAAWVLFDDDNLYVACRCLMADPSQIVANDMRRDSTNLRQNDNFGVFLDTFHDRRNGYLFYVSPVGGMFDGATANERTNNADWNTIWDAKVTRSAGGLDRRDRDSVQVAALPARPRADLGHQPAAHDPRQERVRLHRADQARMGRRRRSFAPRPPRRWSASRCRPPARTSRSSRTPSRG